MKLLKTVTYLFLLIIVVSCSQSKKTGKTNIKSKYGGISEDSLLTLVQYQTFQYFFKNADPTSGMAKERTHLDGLYPDNDQHVVTSGGTGFGLMAILVGVERGFISSSQAIEHFEKVLTFLETADSFHGVFPHWWDGRTGKVQPFTQKDDGGDLVETAFLMQGLLTVREYFSTSNDQGNSIIERIDKIWKSVEWNWHTQGNKNVLYWHWSPNYGWEMNFPVTGYNECLIMYVLAAASPTYPIDASVYHKGWALNGDIINDTTYLGYKTELNHYGNPKIPVGPLFWAHYSFLGLDPTNLSDRYADYWKLNRNHTMINHAYAVENPKKYKGYSDSIWGLTSSYSMDWYSAHRPENDIGVISPTAALSSFPYAPEQSMKFLKYLYFDADSLVGKYGPYDAFSHQHNWYITRYLAIDQGPIPVMIENYRTRLLWDLFMKAPEIKMGLQKLGFSIKKL